MDKVKTGSDLRRSLEGRLPESEVVIVKPNWYSPHPGNYTDADALGMVMDALPMILLTLPTLFPVVVDLGFHPIHFGVLVVLMCELANISPPMGMNLYIVKGVAKEVPLEQIVVGMIPFAVLMIVFIGILVTFPQISLYLPGLMK